MTHFSDYIIFSNAMHPERYEIQTFFCENMDEVKVVLRNLTYAWCHQNIKWENNEKPKTKTLFHECWTNKSFGDIATILEYSNDMKGYFEW